MRSAAPIQAVRITGRTKRPQKYRLVVGSILLLCVIIGIYAVICGQMPYSSDRGNYAYRFTRGMDIRGSSVGLFWLEEFLRIFSNEPAFLFFSVAFLCLLITLIAYCSYPEVKPEALLFTGLSSYCCYSFYLLKQAPAIALVALSVAAFMQRKRILCIVTLVIAIMFHESTYIMIPVFIVMLGAKSKVLRLLEYIALLLCLLFFRQITAFVASFVQIIIPGMSVQISGYLDSSGAIETSNSFLTVLKGFPYYLITIYATTKRKSLKDKISNFDRYLAMCVFASCTIIMSGFMYWMWRFAAYCYFPMFVFASLLYRATENPKDRSVFSLLLFFSLSVLTLRSLIQYYFVHGGF